MLANQLTEATYYGRHFRLPGFSESHQARLKAARVLVVGVGGLGCPAALYLAGAGVGHITLCDADDVSATNLHRQVLFHAGSVGERKVEVAAARLRATNPLITIDTIAEFADSALLSRVVPGYDLVLDGTDNFSAKFAINDACEAAGVPLVYGSIFQFEGQVSVFHLRVNGEPGYSYRDLYPSSPPPGLAQNCGEAGVIGVLPGVIGTLQATEAVKVLAGIGEPLSGALLTFDALTANMRKLELRRRLSGATGSESESAGEVSYEGLLKLQASGAPPLLVDVRDAHERELANIGGEHMPLNTLPGRLGDFSVGRPVVVYCKSGLRSSRAALYLRSALPEGIRVLSLKGGLDACLGSGIACVA